MLILRAFAPLTAGGLGATKVGVVSNSNEASASLLAGIKAEAANLPESQRNNIVYQEVVTTDYSGAINALQAAGCDTVILTVIGADFTTALTTMANANYYCKALTSYNNASAAVFNASYDLDGDGKQEEIGRVPLVTGEKADRKPLQKRGFFAWLCGIFKRNKKRH